MGAELTPQEKFHAESPETMVPRQLLEGRSRETIHLELVRLGWSSKAAQAMIERIAGDIDRFQASAESRAALRHECRGQLFSGLLLVFVGIFASAMSFFAMAAGAMPLCILFTGAFLYGCVRTSRGYARWRMFRHDTVTVRKPK
jgi:hypothetical protein